MDRIRTLFSTRQPAAQTTEYTQLDNEGGDIDVDVDGFEPSSMTSSTELLSPRGSKTFSSAKPISWFDYMVFLVLGVAMLWAWNCFLAAAAYFQMRFRDNKAILDSFQSSIMSVSTVTTLLTTLLLSYMQKSARYPYRVTCALIINMIVFTLLALSTIMFTSISSGLYLAFTLVMVLGTAASAGFFQNGLFAYVGGFGPIYAQAVMAGQGVAGVLPSIAQMVTVLAIPTKTEGEDTAAGDAPAAASPKSAFAYFLTATAVSGAALLLFSVLLRRHRFTHASHPAVDDLAESDGMESKKNVSLWTLLKKLPLPAYAVFLTFAVTMAFPVFTQATLSVNPPSTSVISRPEVFIPFSFLVWNTGDLIGRVLCGFPKFACTNPTILAIGATARILFLPLYYLCNLKGNGAKVGSDLFYWMIQVTFGFTNGYLGSNSMMVAPSLVDEDQISASGGFMGLCLVAGLAVGSIGSFFLNF